MENLSLCIRKIQKNDESQIYSLCKKCFSDQEAIEVVESLFDIDDFFVIEKSKDNEIIGLVAFGLYSLHIGHIMILAVHPNYQNKGIGTLLLEKVVNDLQKQHVRNIRLEVRTTNLNAIKFYEKHNFRIVDTLEQYYADLEDAFLMIYEIEENQEKK